MAVAVNVERRIFQGRLGRAVDVNSGTLVVNKSEAALISDPVDYQIEKSANPDGLVVSNKLLTKEDRERVGRGLEEVWGEGAAFDQAGAFYDRAKAEYCEFPLLNRIKGGLERLLRPHTLEVSIPVPNIAKLRKMIATSIL